MVARSTRGPEAGADGNSVSGAGRERWVCETSDPGRGADGSTRCGRACGDVSVCRWPVGASPGRARGLTGALGRPSISEAILSAASSDSDTRGSSATGRDWGGIVASGLPPPTDMSRVFGSGSGRPAADGSGRVVGALGRASGSTVWVPSSTVWVPGSTVCAPGRDSGLLVDTSGRPTSPSM